MIRHSLVLLAVLSCCLSLPITLPLPSTLDTSRYTTTVGLQGSDLTMYYNIDSDQEMIEVALQGNTAGYVAWGMSNSGGMVNSDVYIGWVIKGVPYAYDYTIKGSQSFGSPNGVDKDVTYKYEDNLLYFNGSESDGQTVMIFVRMLDTGDDADVVIGNTSTLIYAMNSNDGPSLQQHDVTPVPIDINWITGSATKDPRYVLKAHGSIMFIAWAFFAPIGYILARFLKAKHWWFHAHMFVMLTAAVLTIVGFGLAIKASSVHFNGVHQIIGLIVFILAVIQPIGGVLADKMYDPDREKTPIFPDKLHWVGGWFVITLGFINVALGLNEFGSPMLLITIYAIVISVVWAVLFVFSVITHVREARKDK